MDGQTKSASDYRFLAGLAMGGVVGAGIAMWLAPKAAAEIKSRAIDSARSLGTAASDRYRDAKGRVSDAVDGFTRKGQDVRDGLCDTVVRGAKDVELAAQSVERFAIDAKTHKVG